MYLCMYMKVARYSFSWSIPAKFDHNKLRCYKQCFWKNCHHSCIIEIKMKISHDQGRNDIGVVIATKKRHYLLYLQQYFSLGTVLTKSFTGTFSSNILG